jgi:hypothetical protein
VRLTIAIGVGLVVAAGFASYALLWSDGGRSQDSGAIAASECDAANRVFTEEGLAPPDTYAPRCPDPEDLRAELRSAQVDTTKFRAMKRAMRSGQIEEDQNPCTYPAWLREVIELSDEQCRGELGRALATQYER